MTTNQLILEAAHDAWQRMAPLRARRRRYARFTYGEQWGDPTTTADGRRVTEAADAEENGCKPLTNNLIRRLVKTVVGRFRQERLQEENPPRRDLDPSNVNRLDELDARTLEEFLISGMAIHRVRRERRPAGEAVWADMVSPDRFFVSAFSDPRGGDIEMAGCLHDMSLAEVLMRFSRGNRQRTALIRRLYGEGVSMVSSAGSTPLSPLQGETDFYLGIPGRCRVVEVWTLESCQRLLCHDPLDGTLSLENVGNSTRLRRLNQQRRRKGLPPVQSKLDYTTLWHCRMLGPNGLELDSFDSPLADGSLPLAIKMYPMVGGEVHSLVEDVIGQQKHVNRLITLMDHIMGVSAKGTLLFPTQCMLQTDDADSARAWERYASQWSRTGAVIPYNGIDGLEPHQVSTSAADVGALEMLRTQIQLFEDISGVNSALMGKNVSAAVGVQRYESELRNSAVSILDLMQTFADFTACRDRLMALA